MPPSQSLDRPGSEGFIWPAEEDEYQSDDEDDFEDPYEHPENKRLLQLGGPFSLAVSYHLIPLTRRIGYRTIALPRDQRGVDRIYLGARFVGRISGFNGLIHGRAIDPINVA